MDKIQKIREEVAKRYNYWREKELNSHSIESETRMSECQHLLLMINSLQEEPVSDDFEEALANEWKGYNDRGAATVDALEDNTQELTFAKGFYRGAKWQKEKDEEEKALIYKHGFNDCREHIMKDAINAEVLENYDGKVIKYDEATLDEKLSKCKVFDKVKIIIIKED